MSAALYLCRSCLGRHAAVGAQDHRNCCRMQCPALFRGGRAYPQQQSGGQIVEPAPHRLLLDYRRQGRHESPPCGDGSTGHDVGCTTNLQFRPQRGLQTPFLGRRRGLPLEDTPCHTGTKKPWCVDAFRPRVHFGIPKRTDTDAHLPRPCVHGLRQAFRLDGLRGGAADVRVYRLRDHRRRAAVEIPEQEMGYA